MPQEDESEDGQDWRRVFAGGGGEGRGGQRLTWLAGYDESLDAEQQQWRGEGRGVEIGEDGPLAEGR